MINFKTSDLVEGLITVTKPLGKPLPLNIGEIVKGEVTDMLSTGSVTLRIKGSFITARTDVPLQKNTEVLLKVIGTPSSPSELKLQFISLAEKENTAPPEFKDESLNAFLQDFSVSDSKSTLTMEQIEGLLKALPSDVNVIPNEIRLQIQNVLQESLKATGQDIQTRLDDLFKDFPAALKDQAGLQGLKLEVTVSIDKLLSDGVAGNLKDLLRDSGVALESKLKAISEIMQPEDAAVTGKDMLSIDIKQLLPASEGTSLENDLKANLLRLKDVLLSQTAAAAAGDATVIKNVTGAVDSILKDIETFQLLSRTTQSFYTFLPVNWQQLKDGEIAFKQNEGDGKEFSTSCRINLDLEDQGKLLIMVLSNNNEFFVSFRPESEEFKSLLASNVGRLEEQFTEKGLNLKAVRVLDKADTSLEKLENLEPYKQIVSIKA